MKLFVLLLFVSFPALAALPQPVADALRAAGIPEQNVAVIVRPLDDNGPVLEHQPDQVMSPASTMKLMTTYAALDMLGPSYRWRTEVYRTGEITDGVLNGDLVIKGYGDPSLMAEDLWRMLAQLRQMGLRDIRGKLVLDDSYFAPQNTDAGAFDGEPYRAYNALPGALFINLKATSFKFYLSDGQVRITTEPWLNGIHVVNRLQPAEGACGDWRARMHYQVMPVDAALATQNPDAPLVEVVFDGTYPEGCGEKYLELSLLDNQRYSYAVFRSLWQQLGGTIAGDVERRAVVPSDIKILTQESATLGDIVRRVNKYSNNLMARQLFLTMASSRDIVPATEAGGVSVVQGWLATKGMQFPELILENGSGLSRHERISARHLADILAHAYTSPVMPEFVSSLPVLSVDGTLTYRVAHHAAGRAHLKTGSLNGVSAIAGYVLDTKGRRWVVVCIVNHPQAAASRSAQDALLEWVADQQ